MPQTSTHRITEDHFNDKPGVRLFALVLPYGEFTIKQEIFCWRMGLHGSGMRAYREAFPHSVTPGAHNSGAYKLMMKDKVIERIKELRKLHDEGKIDLREGPWEYYDISDEGKDRPSPTGFTFKKAAEVLSGIAG